MSMLSNLKSNENIEDEKDTIGNSFLVESGLHNMLIDMAYLEKSSGGALAVNLHFKGENSLVRQVIYITSGDAKGNKSTYQDKEGKTKYLPGYNQVNTLALLTLGKDISSLDHEEKIVKRWDQQLKKEVPQKTNVIIDLINQPITVGFIKVIEDKNVKNDTGVYVPSGETREINEIDKFFRAADGLTLSELRGGVTNPEFRDKWSDKWEGKTKNKSIGTVRGTTSGSPTTGTASKNTSSNLFS